MSDILKELEKTLLSSLVEFPENIKIAIEEDLKGKHFNSKIAEELYNEIVDSYKENTPICLLNIAYKKKNLENFALEVLATTAQTKVKHNISILKDRYELDKMDLLAKKILAAKDDKNTKQKFIQNYNEMFADSNKTVLNFMSLGSVAATELSFVCEDYLPFLKKTTSLLVAPGDTGKTFLALKSALKFKLNQIKNKTYKKCFCWFSEDDLYSVIKKRELEIIETFPPEDRKLLLEEKYNDLITVTSSESFAIMTMRNYEPTIDARFHVMRNNLKEYELVIIDPLTNFYAGEENDNFYARAFMNIFNNWAKNENKAILLLHNTPSGNKEKARGAEAIRDASKVLYIAKKIKDKDGNIIPNSKNLDILIDKDNYNIKNHIEQFHKTNYNNTKRTLRLEIFPTRVQ